MPIYRLTKDRIEPVPEISFADAGILERVDLQRLLRDQIDVVAPDTLVIAEEFGEFEGSNRSIDLLAVDSDGNLVVIELKRTETGGHMDLQAIRYAAMISTMTFDQAVSCFEKYLEKRGDRRNAKDELLSFLEWDNEDEHTFAKNVRVILASADFSQEITATVLWLNEQGLDIGCVRLRPYGTRESLLVDVQQVIPLPEAADYHFRLREKQQRERVAREASGQNSAYSVTVGDQSLPNLAKRRGILQIVKYLCNCGVSPEQLIDAAGIRQGTLFRWTDGHVDSAEFIRKVGQAESDKGRSFLPQRYFVQDDELIHFQVRTYALMRRWGSGTDVIIVRWQANFPETPFQITSQ